MLKKTFTAAFAVVVGLSLVFSPCMISTSYAATSGFKSSTSTSRSSSPSSSPSKSNVSGYKSSKSSSAGTTTQTDKGKVTSAGGNTSGYKRNSSSDSSSSSRPSTSTSSTTSNHYYGDGGGSGWGLGASVLGGMALGSMFASPHTVVYGGTAAGGYAQPAMGFGGFIAWVFSWIFLLAFLGGIGYILFRFFKRRRERRRF